MDAGKSDTEQILDQMEKEIESELGESKAIVIPEKAKESVVDASAPAAVENVLDCLDATTGDASHPQRAESEAPYASVQSPIAGMAKAT